MNRPVHGHDRGLGSTWLAAALLLAWGLGLLLVAWLHHRTPLYGVETDLLTYYIPAARDLYRGTLRAENYAVHGPGYPVLLAASSILTGGGEFYLAARVLNVVAAVAAGAFTYLLIRGFLGGATAVATLLALLVNPVFVRATVEASTDMPALALSLASTWLIRSDRAGASTVLAGLLAAMAIITRYSAIFLIPAAAIVLALRPGRALRLAAYAAGLAVPTLAWLVPQVREAANPFHTQTYLNVAYEIHGRGMSLERFWAQSSGFGSLADVVRFDPFRFVTRVATNIATRWLENARSLMPVYVGVLALPGMFLVWRRRPGWPFMAVHFVLGYLALAPALYMARFFLYLLPFYLSGAMGLLTVQPPIRSELSASAAVGPGRRRALRGAPRPGSQSVSDRGGRRHGWRRRAGWVVATGLIMASAVQAYRETAAFLADAPHETRVAGEVLRTIGSPGEGVMARKPHVAYFADMRFVPMPNVETFPELYAQARAANAQYLFFSPIEGRLRHQFAVLAEPLVPLPGIELVRCDRIGARKAYCLYRFTREEVSVAALQDSLLSALRALAASRPGEGWPLTLLASHLIEMKRYRDALATLDSASPRAPEDPVLLRLRAIAHAELGEFAPAAAACERLLRLDPQTAWAEGYIGRIRRRQGRLEEARHHLEIAARQTPTNPEHWEELGFVCFESGEWTPAAWAFEKVLDLNARSATARYHAALAWLQLGRRDRAAHLLATRGDVDPPDAVRLAALADSVLGISANDRRPK